MHYFDLESALDDESIMTVGKIIEDIKDQLGETIQELEDTGFESDDKQDEDSTSV